MNYLDTMAALARKGSVIEQVLVVFVLKRLPDNLANFVLIDSKDGLQWNFFINSLKNIQLMNYEPERLINSQCEAVRIEAFTKKIVKNGKQ